MFPKGVTVAQAEQTFRSCSPRRDRRRPEWYRPTSVAASQVASPGYGNTFSATFETGRTYVVLCFISDQKGGPPHAIAHKMYKVFTIS